MTVADPAAAASPRPAPGPRRAASDLDLPASTRRSSTRSPPREPDWLARRPAAALERVRGAADRVEPPVHAVRRPARRRRSRTSVASDAATATRPRRRRAARRHRRARRVRGGGMPRSSLLDAARRGRRDRSRRSGSSSRRDPAAARACSTAGAPLPADDKLAQLTRAAWSQGVVAARARRRPARRSPIVLRWAVGAPDRALLTRTIVELGEGAEASLVEELVPSDARVAGSPVAVRRHDRGPPRAEREARVASLQELRPTTVAFQHRHRRHRRRAPTSTGRSPSSAAGSSAAASTTASRATAARSSRSRSSSARDDQLFDLTSYTRHVGRDTTGNLLSKGVLLDARGASQGPDHDREERGRHGQLPRRVRHEPLEDGPLGRDPVARDRPAGLPPGGALVARSGRSTRPSCSTSRAAASRPTTRASSSCSASSSRSWPGSRSRMAQDRLRELLEAKWDAGLDAGHDPATPRPEPTTPAPAWGGRVPAISKPRLVEAGTTGPSR